MKNVPILIFSLLIILNNVDVLAQLSVEQMKADVLELRKALEKNHPGLYWYTSKKQFDSIWYHLNSQIKDPMKDIEFFRLLLPVVASVKCSHTLFYPSKNMISHGKRFPSYLNFIQEKGYLITDSVNNIPNGSELLSINGKPLGEIVKTILPNLQAQGGNLGWKYVILENDFQNYYYYIVDHSDQFAIEYIDSNTKQRVKKELPGLSKENLKTHWASGIQLKMGRR